MFTLGIPKRDYRRATQVLGYESAEEIPYNATLQEDGFYIFTFPEVGDEYSFRKIANRLKSEGIRVIGADAQLTEKKIMKLASLINLEPLKEIDLNDPALMRARAAKGQGNQMKSNPRISFDQVLDLRNEKQDLELEIENIYSQMQNDPDIEPEGGPLADEYGDKLNRLETRLYKVMKQISSYDMNEGEDEDEDKDEDDDLSEAHDPAVLPHEYNDEDLEKLFKKAEVPAEVDASSLNCICSRPECKRCFPPRAQEFMPPVSGAEAWAVFTQLPRTRVRAGG